MSANHTLSHVGTVNHPNQTLSVQPNLVDNRYQVISRIGSLIGPSKMVFLVYDLIANKVKILKMYTLEE